MTIEEQLKELIIKKSGSVNKFSLENGLSTSTVATVFVRGVRNTNLLISTNKNRSTTRVRAVCPFVRVTKW